MGGVVLLSLVFSLPVWLCSWMVLLSCGLPHVSLSMFRVHSDSILYDTCLEDERRQETIKCVSVHVVPNLPFEEGEVGGALSMRPCAVAHAHGAHTLFPFCPRDRLSDHAYSYGKLWGHKQDWWEGVMDLTQDELLEDEHPWDAREQDRAGLWMPLDDEMRSSSSSLWWERSSLSSAGKECSSSIGDLFSLIDDMQVGGESSDTDNAPYNITQETLYEEEEEACTPSPHNQDRGVILQDYEEVVTW
ncbi:hypothetical protein [Candidatus Hepatobacter penaei]|uniref:hypothetical protein n=1 Tax=Candidatus Hepatobacter penaei TaxID=1274402 RepID=UPI0004F3D512|nr:hypothetical protein [Candidatus Hepatobacter penaei]